MGERSLKGNPPNARAMSREQNSECIQMGRELLGLRRVDLGDADAVRERIDWYLDLCERHGSKPLLSGFCMALNTTRDGLMRWTNGDNTGTWAAQLTPESSLIIKNALNLMSTYWEYAFANDEFRNPVTGIFLGKNNFGYKDTTENINVQIQGSESRSPAQIMARYASALPAEDVRVEVPAEEAGEYEAPMPANTAPGLANTGERGEKPGEYPANTGKDPANTARKPANTARKPANTRRSHRKTVGTAGEYAERFGIDARTGRPLDVPTEEWAAMSWTNRERAANAAVRAAVARILPDAGRAATPSQLADLEALMGHEPHVLPDGTVRMTNKGVPALKTGPHKAR